MQPTIGRTLIYKVTATQAQEINRRRTDSKSIADRIAKNTPESSAWPIDTQAHIGNPVTEGQEFPLVVVKATINQFGEGKPGVNGQVILDGNDVFWVTNAGQGSANGQWHWPERY